MKTYSCVECGNDFKKSQLDPDFFKDGEYYCESCADSLAEVGWDSVDPDHNFESFAD